MTTQSKPSKIYQYLEHGGCLRFAVPDAYHPSGYVRDLTRPGGLEPGADDHKYFYSIYDIRHISKATSFHAVPLEYFDNNGRFHRQEYDFANGYVSRCSKNYLGRFTNNPSEMKKLLDTTEQHLRQQFYDNKISYTSLLVDFIK